MNARGTNTPGKRDNGFVVDGTVMPSPLDVEDVDGDCIPLTNEREIVGSRGHTFQVLCRSNQREDWSNGDRVL